MASFSGTISEFRQYIGPFARNLVQNITRKHKKTIGQCQGEECVITEKLQAAHVGRDRNEVIDDALAKLGTIVASGIDFTVDLASFKGELTQQHLPFDKTIKILCPACHKKHDSRRSNAMTSTPTGSQALGTSNLQCSERDGCLPIFLVPSDPVTFKREFLESRMAEIEIDYADGSIKVKPWRLTKFSGSSNVFHNLRSMPDFRKGKWQELGIAKITVRVIRRT